MPSVRSVAEKVAEKSEKRYDMIRKEREVKGERQPPGGGNLSPCFARIHSNHYMHCTHWLWAYSHTLAMAIANTLYPLRLTDRVQLVGMHTRDCLGNVPLSVVHAGGCIVYCVACRQGWHLGVTQDRRGVRAGPHSRGVASFRRGLWRTQHDRL